MKNLDDQITRLPPPCQQHMIRLAKNARHHCTAILLKPSGLAKMRVMKTDS